MYDRPLTQTGFVANRLAVFDAGAKSLKYVSGLPDASLISSFGNTPYCEEGTAHIAISTTNGYPAVYQIDAATATATKGTIVEATAITGIGRLK